MQSRASGSLFRLIDNLFEFPILTIPQAKRLNVTYPSAKANVDKLVGADILRQMGESPAGKVYGAPEILDILT